ncbi:MULTISPECIES: hypothetical protein [unclassified Moraxella]|uniref:hypothetical protein n=1 Tax=unclassified Moraxella TaxID=2685852 RepID=UPI003AF89C29
MSLKVILGKQFREELRHFPTADQEKIANFIEHVQLHGLNQLEGRNKKSDNVPKDNPNWLSKVKFAQQYNLWHYHIGIPSYDVNTVFGDRTSEYILHYVLYDDMIKIVDFSDHPPFKLPSESYLIHE